MYADVISMLWWDPVTPCRHCGPRHTEQFRWQKKRLDPIEHSNNNATQLVCMVSITLSRVIGHRVLKCSKTIILHGEYSIVIRSEHLEQWEFSQWVSIQYSADSRFHTYLNCAEFWVPGHYCNSSLVKFRNTLGWDAQLGVCFYTKTDILI